MKLTIRPREGALEVEGSDVDVLGVLDKLLGGMNLLALPAAVDGGPSLRPMGSVAEAAFPGAEEAPEGPPAVRTEICRFCDNAYATREELAAHVHEAHRKAPAKRVAKRSARRAIPKGKGLKCPECGEPQKGKIGLGIHRSKTHGVKGAFHDHQRRPSTSKSTRERTRPSLAAPGPGPADVGPPAAASKRVDPSPEDPSVPLDAAPAPAEKLWRCRHCPESFDAAVQLRSHREHVHHLPPGIPPADKVETLPGSGPKALPGEGDTPEEVRVVALALGLHFDGKSPQEISARHHQPVPTVLRWTARAYELMALTKPSQGSNPEAARLFSEEMGHLDRLNFAKRVLAPRET
jgi:ribosomal protein L37AE/L43A